MNQLTGLYCRSAHGGSTIVCATRMTSPIAFAPNGFADAGAETTRVPDVAGGAGWRGEHPLPDTCGRIRGYRAWSGKRVNEHRLQQVDRREPPWTLAPRRAGDMGTGEFVPPTRLNSRSKW